MSELKPCPFCGNSSAEITRYGNARCSTIVSCQNCGCELESNENFNHGTDWNNRPIEDTLRQQIEASEERVKELEDQRKLYREALWRAKTICETYFELTNIADMKRLGEAIEKEAKAILQKGKDNGAT